MHSEQRTSAHGGESPVITQSPSQIVCPVAASSLLPPSNAICSPFRFYGFEVRVGVGGRWIYRRFLTFSFIDSPVSPQTWNKMEYLSFARFLVLAVECAASWQQGLTHILAEGMLETLISVLTTQR